MIGGCVILLIMLSLYLIGNRAGSLAGFKSSFESEPHFKQRFAASNIKVIDFNQFVYRHPQAVNSITYNLFLCECTFERERVKCQIIIRDARLVKGQIIENATLSYCSPENGYYNFWLIR